MASCVPLAVKRRGRELLLLFLGAPLLPADPRCVTCHPKEVAGYATSAMARALAPISSAAKAAVPDGAFEHSFSKTKFFVRSTADGMTQGFTQANESAEQKTAFVIGSGSHAFGYLIQVGDHVFQSPLSYYTGRRSWDVAPGYENDPHPDFTRPITEECLFCHSGKALPLADSVSRYQLQVFGAFAISCDRCHGDPETHLKNPARGSIVNPSRLSGAARASVCEQCHLAGETRIPNPGRAISDFRPGQTLETYYTTFVAARASGEAIKVVSHAEQLALSKCARGSGDKLWCGTCHDPHDKPAKPAAYFRDRCLSCHAATLEKEHAAPGRNCVACHMPKAPARDGGHTAFTNHWILRQANSNQANSNTGDSEPDTLTAWREPEPALQDRNLALALVAAGLENHSSAELIRGYRMMNRIEKDFPDDPALFTSLGTVLMKGKQPVEALKRFEKVEALKPNYPPYRMNMAMSLAALNRVADAIQELQKAVTLDPLFRPAVDMLATLYREQRQPEKADRLLRDYRSAMGISIILGDQ